jgi:hypothetical protein
VLVIALGAILLLRVATRDDDSDPQGEVTATTDLVDRSDGDSGDDDDGDDGDDGDDATTSTAAGAAPTGLEATLLRLSDLPDGWVGSEEAGQVEELCDGRDPVAEVPPDDLAQVGFNRGATGPVLSNVVTVYPNEDEAGDLLDAVRESIARCDEFATESGAYTLTETDVSGLGDEAVAATLSGDTELGELKGQLIYVRVDDRVAALALVGIGDVDPDLARELIELVTDRL